jgi:hypothetical protein
MELKKKMEEIYLKIQNLGENSFFRKSAKARKEEYNHIKKEEEIKKIEEAEKKEKGGLIKTGLFSTQI